MASRDWLTAQDIRKEMSCSLTQIRGWNSTHKQIRSAKGAKTRYYARKDLVAILELHDRQRKPVLFFRLRAHRELARKQEYQDKIDLLAMTRPHAEVIVDTSFDALSFHRPSLQLLREKVESRKVSEVVVTELTDLVMFGYQDLVATFAQYGTVVTVARRDPDTETFNKELRSLLDQLQH